MTNARFASLHGLLVAPSPSRRRPFHSANPALVTSLHVLTRDQRFAYTSNTGSGTISGYRVGWDGKLQLLNANGITGTTGTGSKPVDMSLSRDSRFLYSLNSGNGTISAFRVNANGSLYALPGLSRIPAGANGLAAQ